MGERRLGTRSDRRNGIRQGKHGSGTESEGGIIGRPANLGPLFAQVRPNRLPLTKTVGAQGVQGEESPLKAIISGMELLS